MIKVIKSDIFPRPDKVIVPKHCDEVAQNFMLQTLTSYDQLKSYLRILCGKNRLPTYDISQLFPWWDTRTSYV